MRIELTSLSMQEVSQIETIDTHKVTSYLEGDFVMRSFSDVLRSVYAGSDIRDKLTRAFITADTSANTESICRKMRNWLSGISVPQSREDLFVIAFALRLSEEQTSILLGAATDTGLHYRNGRELCYAYCLRRGYDYTRARALFRSLPPLETNIQDDAASYTQSLRDEFASVQDDEAFRCLYRERLSRMGRMHNKAYTYFTKYLEILMHPETFVHVSLEEVTREYLSIHIQQGRSRSGLTAVKKLIAHGWPNATMMKNMCLRKEDITRKLLILLYLITENIVDGEYDEADEDYIPPQDRMETHWYNLSLILDDCGMPPLDPRLPFDWLALYALHVTDDNESMYGRMETVLAGLFKNG